MKKAEFNPGWPPGSDSESAFEDTPNADEPLQAQQSPEVRSALINRLFREHNRSLMNFLVTRLRSVQEARDVAQESYVRLLQLHRPGAVSLLRAYLFRTAANLAVDRLRRRAVRERSAVELFDEMSEEQAPDRAVLARQEFDIVRSVLRELPEKSRRAFVLHMVEGLSTPEVAKLMGLKERMVRLHVARALAECKLRLGTSDRTGDRADDRTDDDSGEPGAQGEQL